MTENYDNYIEISKTDCSFEKMYKKEYLSKNIIDDIKKANVLLIPNEKYTDYPVFPERTNEFFDYLKSNINNKDVIVDICIDDDNYKTLEMHDAVLILTSIILQEPFYSIIVNIISNYVYDLMKITGNKSMEMKVDITIERNGESREVHYEGPANSFNKAMNSIGKNIIW